MCVQGGHSRKETEAERQSIHVNAYMVVVVVVEVVNESVNRMGERRKGAEADQEST